MRNRIGALFLLSLLVGLGTWLTLWRAAPVEEFVLAPLPEVPEAEQALAKEASVNRSVVRGEGATGAILVKAQWSDGSAAANLAIWITSSKPGKGDARVRRLRSGLEGELLVGLLAPGNYTLKSQRGPEVAASVRAEETTELTYRASAGSDIRGIVVSHEELAVPGAIILGVKHKDAGPGHAQPIFEDGGNWEELAVAGNRGEFVVRDAVVPGSLRAIASDGRMSDPIVVQRTTGPVRLRLEKVGVVLSGRVQLESGEPVHLASVTVGSPGRKRAKFGMKRPIGRVLTGKTDVDGRFAIESLMPGRLSITVTATGLAPRSLEADINARQDNALTIVMHEGATISGIVTTAGGEPAENVIVSAQRRQVLLTELIHNPIGLLKSWEAPYAVSDANGRFEVRGVEAGDVCLCAALWEKGRGRTLATSLTGVVQENRVVTIPGRLDWNPQLAPIRTILVRVVDADGKTRNAGVEIRAFAEGVARDERPSALGVMGRDEDGVFYEIGPCEGVAHTVALACPTINGERKWVIEHGVIPGGELLELVYAGAGDVGSRDAVTIVGRIRDDGGRRADDRARWRVQLCSMRRMSWAKLDGPIFRLTGHFVGKHMLRVMDGKRVVSASEWFEVPQAPLWDVGELIVKPGGAVEIQCGVAREDASMSMYLNDSFRRLALERRGDHFVLEDIQPGEYSVHMSANGWALEERSVIVSPYQTSVVSVHPEPGVRRSLQIVMPPPMEWQGVKVWIGERSGRKRYAVGEFYSKDFGWDPLVWVRTCALGQFVLVIQVDGREKREWQLDWRSGGSGEPEVYRVR